MEFALIAMPLILLLFLIVEAAFLMKDYVSVSSAVRGGARTASASADAGPGTCETGPDVPPCLPGAAPALAQGAAQAIQTTSTALNPEDVDWLVVYEPGADGNPIGSSSLECGGTNCVTFIWNVGLEKFVYLSGTWDSASINACLNHDDRTSVGVGMQVSHSMVSGLFGTTTELQEQTVMQFEPLVLDVCGPHSPNPHA